MTTNNLEKAAKNGLIHRRHLLGLSLGAAGTLAARSVLGAEQGLQFEIPGWSKLPGPGASIYGKRSSYTENIGRQAGNPNPL